jgi:hypothetical protein
VEWLKVYPLSSDSNTAKKKEKKKSSQAALVSKACNPGRRIVSLILA